MNASVEEAIGAALQERASVVALWLNPPVVPSPISGPRYTAIYALPSLRFATLRHWRDELETRTSSGAHLVALEASKWARLLLKSHGGALLTSFNAPEFGTPEGHALPELARALWDETAQEWASLASADVPAELVPSGRRDRFQPVEQWLRSVRDRADSAQA